MLMTTLSWKLIQVTGFARHAERCSLFKAVGIPVADFLREQGFWN